MTPWFLPAIRFSLQLLVCEVPFFVALKPRKGLWWRVIAALLVYEGLSVGTRWIYRQIPVSNNWLSFSFYFIIFFYTFLFMAFCFRIHLKSFLFCGVGGYAVEHVAFCLSTMVKYYVTQSVELNTFTDHIFFRIMPYIIMDIVVYFAFIRRGNKQGKLENSSLKMTIVSFLILCACLLLSVFVGGGTLLSDVICRAYGAISCSLGLFLQFNFHYTDKLERDNMIMDQLLHAEKIQHEMKKEVVEQINIKCHDIKYRLGTLGNMSKDERAKVIEEMQDSVMVYDSIAETGNKALDLVLTEKSMICNKHNITFSCIADGGKLNFMSSADVSSLFGNAMDNAIESVVREADEGKRFISVRVSGTETMLFVNLENYCAEELTFEDGLPQTTKEDKEYHGFGTRSMKYIAQKYGGEMRMEQRENIFFLDFYFPLKTAL